MKKIVFACLSIFAMSFPAFADVAPEVVKGATTVSVEQAAQLFDQGVVFIDVRKASDFEAGRVPGAVHLDVKSALTAESLAAVIGTGDQVEIYCNGVGCLLSSEASELAVGWGFTQVLYFRESYPGWEAAGQPIE